MLSSNIKVNPVKATCWKYQGIDHGIQGINDTCFGICAAFSGTNDAYNSDPKCTQACEDLVEKRKIEIFGVGSCDHQVPYKPVIWQEIPRFVPQLLRQGYSVEDSKERCLKMCEETSLVNECRENCLLDYHAIEVDKSVPMIGKEPIKINSIEGFKSSNGKQQDSSVWGKIIFGTLLFALLIGLIIVFVIYKAGKKF